MAIYTQLSPCAIPGERYSFVAKASAAGKGIGPFTELSVIGSPGLIHSFVAKAPTIGEKGVGPFTALSVTAISGAIHSFIAKAPAIGGVKGEGLFTELSVLSLPGGRHIFLPKSIVVPVPEEPEITYDASGGVSGKVQEDLYRWRLRDDKEILDIIMTIVLSGRL